MDILKGLHGEFAWFIWGLVLLGVIWFFTGGPRRESAHEGQYIEPLAPVDTGRVYGKYYEGGDTQSNEDLNLPKAPANLIRGLSSIFTRSETVQEKVEETHVSSILSRRIVFNDFGKASQKDPNEEYLRLKVDETAKESQKLTGLVLRGTGLNTAILIPKAALLPIQGETPERTDVYLPPGGTAVITTGRSPIGTSFRVNKCMGYLEQFQNFSPDLAGSCPTPASDIQSFGPAGDQACDEFVKEIPRCTVYQGSLPKSMSASCVSFLAEKLNYNACVENHRNDKDFYQNEWRLFLNQPNEIWKNKDEIIRLMDSKGEVIDAITY